MGIVVTAVTEGVLDAAVGAARRLMPEATEDRQADFAARLIELLPARISTGVVQSRANSESTHWLTVANLDPAEAPRLNAAYGWAKYRVVEIGVCP